MRGGPAPARAGHPPSGTGSVAERCGPLSTDLCASALQAPPWRPGGDRRIRHRPTGATGPTETSSGLALSADLAICEATYREPPEEGGPRLLLTSTEAGRRACEARAKRLMVVHFWPEDGRLVSRDLAAAQFAEDLIWADEGMALTLE